MYTLTRIHLYYIQHIEGSRSCRVNCRMQNVYSIQAGIDRIINNEEHSSSSLFYAQTPRRVVKSIFTLYISS